MAGTFKFELVTPERMALSQDATQVVVPGLEGDFAVLPGHAPVISALRPGVVVVTLPDASRTRIFVKGGFAEVDPQHLTVLAERALDVEAMDAGTIAAELAAAEAELAAAADDTARLAATSALDQLRGLQRG
ncbi:MAG TPA: F0F1 ATP synthase subunit epsilon [Hyphomicrobiaceae bacterium]|jgi:F-type H+-transporting ATPase subunit epsilon|nr:F0F1 ATP synthase subunit epsilon [Hyphomicrobiaceae bacterium]